MALCGLFQSLLFLYKRVKSKRITTQQRLASILAGPDPYPYLYLIRIFRVGIACLHYPDPDLWPRKLPSSEWDLDFPVGNGHMRRRIARKQVSQIQNPRYLT